MEAATDLFIRTMSRSFSEDDFRNEADSQIDDGTRPVLLLESALFALQALSFYDDQQKLAHFMEVGGIEHVRIMTEKFNHRVYLGGLAKVVLKECRRRLPPSIIVARGATARTSGSTMWYGT